MRQPLKHRPFRRVWLGETVSLVGDYSFEVAFIWLILNETGSTTTLATILLVQAVPRGVLMLVGGAVTDRLSPRAVMFCSHTLRGLAVATLGLIALTDHVSTWHLYALGALTGVAEAFFWPAAGSIIPSLLPPEHLARGNALVGFGEQGARLLGPILGGALVAAVGTSTTILLNAFTFFFAALTVFGAPRRQPADQAGDQTSDQSSDQAGEADEGAKSFTAIRREIVEGLRYAGRSREIRTVLLLIGAAALSYSGLFSVGLPALAKTFPQGSLALGVLLSAWGLGQLIGTIGAVFTGLPRRWGLLIIGMTLCEGTAFVLLGFLPSVWSAAVVLTLLGIGVAYSSDVALPTFIQTRTPTDVLGRVSSVMELPRATLEPLSIAAMGLLVGWDIQWAFVLAAIPMLAVGLHLALDREARALSTTAPEEHPAAKDPDPLVL
ncbi:MFS transporter [Kitasatospora sp. NPDC059811]|uniref:MFS transporter n=1 Tax=Streptomycetaceae TaxID=2062 RepID=UPI001AD82FCD|nr:MFS transporter [Streptomyces sp. MJM8645]